VSGFSQLPLRRASCIVQVLGTQVHQLAKQAAEIALRLAALPADGLRNNLDLDLVEQLATRILKEVAAVRAAQSHPVGETRGMWPIMRRQ
ncbi:MAG: hypothetical protein ABI759_24150, partial [Candidatus Solibacter sp.]